MTQTQSSAAPPPLSEEHPLSHLFSEEELLASDRARNILKNSGALDALETLNAMRLDMRHEVRS